MTSSKPESAHPFEQDVQPGEMVVTNFSLATAADDIIAVGDDELLSHLLLCGHRDCLVVRSP